MAEESTLHFDTDVFRRNLNKYTERIFRLLPPIDKPRILDIGCGSGVPTIELAKLSGGTIVAIDIHQHLIDKVNEKAAKAGLSDRIEAIRCSLLDMHFPDESFDIVWAEGSISVIGFKRGLVEWDRLLKSQGFLAVHDEAADTKKKLKQVEECEYRLISHIDISVDDWWREYYGPMEKRINEIKDKYRGDRKILENLKVGQREVEFFKKYPKRCASVFIVMQKL